VKKNLPPEVRAFLIATGQWPALRVMHALDAAFTSKPSKTKYVYVFDDTVYYFGGYNDASFECL